MTEEQFDDASLWPRRLLHVPTMASLPWKPGNRYGNYSNPKYNAVSYTWGRWELKDRNERPEIKALPVKGAEWFIPRIHPERFTVKEFQAMVNDTVIPHPSRPDHQEIEFLWLDIACIHQEDQDENAREVGRQANIFKGAAHTYVWLKHDTAFIRRWAPAMEKEFSSMCSKNFHIDVDLNIWAARVTSLIEELIADPWFSSLWTLQESFLCPNADLIFRDGAKNSLDLCSLKHICELFLTVRDTLSYNDIIRRIDLEYGLSDLINKTGLLDSLEGNPMGLLTASRNRTTSYEVDRVYGIMQIFDFQLGKSSPEAITGHKYSLDELSDQLGEALLLKYPILSQLHIHTSPVKNGKAWRFSHSSVVPEHARLFFRNMQSQGEADHLTELSTLRLQDGMLLGMFSGPTVLFTTFAARLTKDWPGSWDLGDARLMLDETFSSSDGSSGSYNGANSRSTSLHRAAWLVKRSPSNIIVILALKRAQESQDFSDHPWEWAIGLILSPGRDPSGEHQSTGHDLKFWRREGVFIWSVQYKRRAAGTTNAPMKTLTREILEDVPLVTKKLPYLLGDDPIWKTRDGLFG
jgi:hypothetical protein